jgi:hypothetical protein
MRRRDRTHRRTDSVDGGVDGFGHGDDDSDRVTAASDSGGRDGEAKRRQLGQRRCRERRLVGMGEAGQGGAFGQRRGTALSRRLLSRPAHSDTAAHGSQSGRGVARHCS